MFEKLSQAAERLATRASRRGFLGRLGKGALALAGALGGVLALPRLVQAGNGNGTTIFCCGGRKVACGYPPGGSPYCQWLCPGATTYTYTPCAGKCLVPASGCVFIQCGCF
jgi:hypothetical protein